MCQTNNENYTRFYNIDKVFNGLNRVFRPYTVTSIAYKPETIINKVANTNGRSLAPSNRPSVSENGSFERRYDRSVYAVRAVYTLYSVPPSSFVRTTRTGG